MAFFEPPTVLIGVVLTTPVKIVSGGLGEVFYDIKKAVNN
ncbi:hypothetical protein PB1E_1963 [Leuconostoc gelidum subsp. gasicomitatum]|nr:hypothetical protein PB1E_1963 [Leuconostoc gasicomitatum]